MPDITVVIPVYNVEKYLKKCVDSVLHQTYKNYEIILVDDGTADSSGIICDELSMKNGNIKVIHQENMGLGGARNTGIKNCNTEYIIFLDSDDCIHPELLEKCIQTLKTNKCDIVLFDMVSVDENGAKGSLYTTPFDDSKILSKIETAGVCIDPSACDKAYKTSLFRDNDIYFPNKVWYEDLRTIPKLLAVAEGVMKIRSEPLYYYLQRSDSIMHTPDYSRMVRERMAAANDLYTYFRKYGILEEYLDMLEFITVYHAFLLPCLEMYRKTGNYSVYLDELLENLNNTVRSPFKNPYLKLLRKNELIILKLAMKKKYFTINCITLFNRKLKKIKSRIFG